MARSLLVTLLASVFFHTATAVYNLAQDYSGDSFFQGWDFFTDADPTSGHVIYQSQVDAKSKGLIRVQPDNTPNSVNNSKQVFIGVDSTNQAPSGRSSVRISTRSSFQHALVLADIAHQPGGICGTWPAFWMVGDNWPQNGEIDIVEGVSTQPTNQMTLHTNAGPVLDHKAKFSGTLLTSNCDVDANNQPKNAGCGIADDSKVTFGANFNAVNGGVYATEWTNESIKIWFFPRTQIPQDILSGNPTPSQSWGTPNSLFQGTFDMDDHFRNLSIVLNTAFCGDWAGAVWSETPECSALAPTCDEYVTKNPQAFEQAFWLINSIKVFQDDGKAANSSALPSIVTSLSAATPSATSFTPSRSHSTITVTKTFTIYPTATPRPRPPFNITNGPATGETSSNEDTSAIAPPDEMFGRPEDNIKRPARRRGGAVLPLKVRNKSLRGSPK